MPRPILATIDTEALSHNLHTVADRLRQDAPGATPFIWAVIKARGYGHGLEAALAGFDQADGLAMLDLEEAVRCRELGWTGPLLLLEGFFEPADLDVLVHYHIGAALHCTEQFDMLESSPVARQIDAFVKLNTGMHRLGFQPDEFRAAHVRALALQADGVLGQVGTMTHFARADDDPAVTRDQIDCFLRATDGLSGPVSLCNSAATLTPGLAAGIAGDPQWVRPGICLYGASPFADRPADTFGLRPAMTLSARLIGVHRVPAGESVGYGHTFRAPRDMRVGIVACGYADGYPRHAPSGTPVVVDGVRSRLVGRVSMDMLAVDLDPVPGAAVGAPVVLWGQGGPSVDEVATACGTIGYELLTAVTPRVPRRVL
ncbi:alanine racemase [Castellaniella daejeonensis]|jgi:alanine racemase|uniref:Alanine racemase n=1 Tax=Castellaniella daejeonensis TaxID=659013 RepID=A0ABN0TK78_9BURK|nr:alanine racemase [Castellaniella sp.]HET8702583.1 alanine racemase [Castellaniella sp.]